MRTHAAISIALLTFASACGGAKDEPAVPALLACQYGETATDDPAPLIEDVPVTAGEPTAEMANAKRLFDEQKFVEAIPELQKIVDGETGDDAGNVQLAEFQLGVAFMKAHAFERALALFEPMAHNPSHATHKAAVVWLAQLLAEPITTVRAVDLLYLYSDSDLSVFDNANQRPMLYLVQLARARAAYRRAHYDEAVKILARVRTYAPLREMADGCSAFASSSRRAPPR